MLKNELKAALAILGTIVPCVAQADQAMNSNQAQQQPGYNSGEMVKAGQLPGAYNQSATYMCDNGWDVYVTGDYLYWKWQQDTFQIGTLVSQTTGDSDGFGNANAVFQDPSYKSGFQVGLGFNMHGMDDWNLYAEYTWYKNTSHATTTGSSTTGLVLPSGAFRGDQHLVAEAALDTTLSTEAKMNFSALDFLLARPFYFGKKLTANFSAGLTALWITQKLTASTSAGTTDLVSDLAMASSSYARQTSWGLGPKFGLDSNWLLGYGLKVMANVSASVLYTRYMTNVNSTTTVGTATATGNSVGLDNYGTLRPVTEMFLGLGWGSYFCDNGFHFDLSVGYDFNVYWNYNMAYATSTQSVGSMYLHGMNIRARFDF
jgi:hypothetical protein